MRSDDTDDHVGIQLDLAVHQRLDALACEQLLHARQLSLSAHGLKHVLLQRLACIGRALLELLMDLIGHMPDLDCCHEATLALN